VFSTTADGASSPTERLRIAQNGAWGLAGANYGSSGQVLTSNGSGSAPTWKAGGKILQVVQTVKTDTFTTTSSSYVDVTGLTASITPSSTNSKILVFANLSGSAVNALGGAPILLRGSTIINQADAASNRGRGSFAGGLHTGDGAGDAYMTLNVSTSCLDSPSTTSSVTYKVQVKSFSGSEAVYINRTQDDADNGDRLRSVSTITLMEVAA
jgi:hypothetical protein